MRLVTQLRALFFLMLALSLGGAALAVWSFEKASHHVERLSLAYTAHAGVLSLKNHTYQLFKQYGDALIIGDRDKGKRERELVSQIRADIGNIRATIGAEIELVGKEEVEELQALAKIEFKIEELIAGLERLSKDDSPDARVSRWGELSRILQSEIDGDFHTMISEALAEESEEVSETRAQVIQEVRFYRAIALFFALVSVIAAMACVWAVSHNVSRPLSVLLEGVTEFGNGDLGHRIGLKGKDEVSKIAATFNMMAERISERTQSLSSEKTALEEAVAERTSQLEGVLEDLQRSDANRRQMLADVSHELRTPLTVIQGEADVALRGGEKPAKIYRDALSRARDAAGHTARLVDDLLFVARTESGNIRLKLEDMDLVSTLNETLGTFGLDVALLTDLESAPMRGDPGRLRQAVLVLLENARHHGGKEITLRLERSPDGFRATVEDNGPGMTDEDKTSAFERFFRGSNAAENYREGVGLGLPIAQAIARAHGGRVELADRPDGGLLATLFVPTRPSLKAVA